MSSGSIDPSSYHRDLESAKHEERSRMYNEMDGMMKTRMREMEDLTFRRLKEMEELSFRRLTQLEDITLKRMTEMGRTIISG